MRYFVFSLCFVTIVGLTSCRDPIVTRHEIAGYGVVELRAFRDWEASVPIYMEIDIIDGKELVSGPFYYAPPDAFESKLLNISIGIFKDIVYVKDKNADGVILAMASISKNLIYPPNNIESKMYSVKIDNLFNELKRSLGDDSLKLRW